MRYHLGLSLSHDASACLISEEGEIIAAIAEERLSRKKNHFGIPLLSIAHLLNRLDSPEILFVHVGSHQLLDWHTAERMLAPLLGNPSNPVGEWRPVGPGIRALSPDSKSPKHAVEEKIKRDFSLLRDVEFKWVKHHDSHLGTCLGLVKPGERNLLLSLDGEGDKESGAVSVLEPDGTLRELARFPDTASLGLMYGAVTQRYNFRQSRHEGKILGLSARGSMTNVSSVLRRHLRVREGVPETVASRPPSFIEYVLRRLNLKRHPTGSWTSVVERAGVHAENYADLAFGAQRVLEEKVLEIAQYWLSRTGASSLVCSGGVFANVLLNQKLAELDQVERLRVFPAMGDDGLSIGAVWWSMKSSIPPVESMYLGPEKVLDDEHTLEKLHGLGGKFRVTKLDRHTLASSVAGLIADGRLVGVHSGRMEFGPRALGNRSVLMDSRDIEIVAKANARFGRTEFMPFAPIVLSEDFDRFFSRLEADVDYSTMTITVDVTPESRGLIPAVVHVDGTARPQIVESDGSDFVVLVLQELKRLSGLGICVNTSMNVHEQPINFSLEDSLTTLASGAIDFLVYDDRLLIEPLD